MSKYDHYVFVFLLGKFVIITDVKTNFEVLKIDFLNIAEKRNPGGWRISRLLSVVTNNQANKASRSVG